MLLAALHAQPASAAYSLRRSGVATTALTSATEREAVAAIAQLVDGRGGNLSHVLRLAQKVPSSERERAQLLRTLPKQVSLIAGSAGKRAPSEDAIKKALEAFNGLLLEAWGRVDRLRASCHESLGQIRLRLQQVETTLARLSDQDSNLKADRSEAIAGLEEANEQVADIRRRKEAERVRWEQAKAGLHAELTARRDDEQVALTLTKATACKGSSLLALGNGTVGGSAGHLCRSSSGQWYMRSGNTELQAAMAMPQAQKYLHFLAQKGEQANALAYMPSDNGDCPEGSQPVHSVKECKEAVRQLGVSKIELCNHKPRHSSHHHHRHSHFQRFLQHHSMFLQRGKHHEKAEHLRARFCKFVRQAPAGDANETTTTITTTTTTTLGFQEVGLVPAAEMAHKCTLGDSTCGPLHASAVKLYGELKDALMIVEARAHKLDTEYERSLQEFNLQLQMIEETKTELSMQLAGATSKMNSVEGELKLSQEERSDLRNGLNLKREECTGGIKDILLGEMCHLKSLRSGVVGMSSQLKLPDVGDCEVSDWMPGECSKRCDDACPDGENGRPCGGVERMTREVVQPATSLGMQCPPLKQDVSCAQVKCPVDCQLSMWSGWSKCSRMCSGGVRQRTRSVLQQARFGGGVCDAATETQPCNTESCVRDCDLKHWTSWGPCSAVCGGGVQERHRHVRGEPLEGAGVCPSRWSPRRFNARTCNIQSCAGDERCLGLQDIYIALDTSASLGDGLAKAVLFAQAVVARYETSATTGYFAAPGSSMAGKATICATATDPPAGVGLACCGTDGNSCESSCNGDSLEELSFADAKTKCEGSGKRLCTKDELAADVCKDATCGAPKSLIWTGEKCAGELGNRVTPPRIGVIQFGNGEVQADGTVSPAKEASALDPDTKKAKEALKKLETATDRGFSNMAQAFMLAENLFGEKGRRDAEAVILVVAKERPPFGVQAQEKAKELWDAGIRIVFASLDDFPDSEDARFLKGLATRPPEANFRVLPGVLTMKAANEAITLAQHVVTMACPHSVSPMLEYQIEQVKGLRLVHENQACGSSVSTRTSLGHDVQDAVACRGLAAEASFKYFSFGRDLRKGECYGEKEACASESFEGPSSTDFYAITEIAN